MRKRLLGVAAIAAAGIGLMFTCIEVRGAGQPRDVKAIAAAFNVKDNLDLTGRKVAYKIPRGFSARIIASTFEQVVDFDGTIYRPISDMTTQVTFELIDGKDKARTPTLAITIPGTIKPSPGSNPRPNVIPALQEWAGARGKFSLSSRPSLVMLSADRELAARMSIFADDLEAMTGRKLVVKTLKSAVDAARDAFVVRLLSGEEARASGLGEEGYTMDITSSQIRITAVAPKGAFWATRTILQVFKQNENTFPCGRIRDYPQYPVRGFMYDVGRKPCELGAVYSVMKTMAYYKLSDLQLHLNDNFIWLHDYTKIPNDRNATARQKKAAIAEVMKAAPTGFRLESDVVGKNGVKLTSDDYFYTKEQFGRLIDDSADYGVRIVPEIDVPGHAMSFVRVRPDLMYRGGIHKPHDVERAAMLDASSDIYDPATGRTYRQETLDFVKSVFDEYLVGRDGKEPVFRDSVVHIGTDEYYGNAEDYRAFADELLRHIKSRGFTPRLWGSLRAKPGKTPVVSDGVQMHIWSRGWQLPQPAIDAGYKIINILDADMYIVPNGTGNVGAYQDYIPLDHLYGPNWQPNIMRQYTVLPGHPQLLGAQWALWNDNAWRRDTGLTDYDLFDRIQSTCSVIAEKTWNTGQTLPYEDFVKLAEELGVAPGTNPRHEIDSKGDLVMDLVSAKGGVADRSENKFSSKKHGSVKMMADGIAFDGGKSFIEMPVENLAPDYIVEMTIMRKNASAQPQILCCSDTTKFYAVQKETGKVGFTRDAWDFSFDYTIPADKWVTLKIVARGRGTTLYADGKKIGGPIRHKFPESFRYSTLVFPLKYIGSPQDAFDGIIKSFKVTQIKPRDLSDAIDSKNFTARASSEHGQGDDGDITKIIDGNRRTWWHSKYNPTDKPPFTIDVDLGRTYEIDCVSFLPRQDGSNNGTVKAARLFVKKAGRWEKVAEYSGSGSERKLQSIPFDACRTNAVRLIITDGANGFGTMAEFYVHKAAAK